MSVVYITNVGHIVLTFAGDNGFVRRAPTGVNHKGTDE